MRFQTDQILWYNNGIWGNLGFAVPNFGDDPTSLNTTIHYLASVMGRNLQRIMVDRDADARTPPSINTLTRVHKLITRARSILAGRGVPSNQAKMEATHASPGAEVFTIYPCPYFKVRNAFLKEWGGLMLFALCEAFQHTENREPYEISEDFAGLIGQYLHRVYKLMSTELFGVPAEEARALDFTLSDEQLGSYNPGAFFTQTEMIDTVPPLQEVPTEDDLRPLTDGIPATELVALTHYPTIGAFDEKGHPVPAQPSGGETEAAANSFAPPPGP